MADPTTNIAAERAIVEHISHDPAVVDDLLKRQVSRRWFTDSLYASVVEAAIALRMRGMDINPFAIMSYSTNNVPPKRWKELFEIWKKHDPPGDWHDYLEPLAASVSLRDFDEVMRDAKSYRDGSPKEIRHWLPAVVSGLSGIASGEAYDPRPSSHFKEDLRTVIGQIGIPHLDRFMKGGIWDAAIAMIGGISNHGKSTLAYTIAYRCVEQGMRVVFITTETLPSEVTVGVLRPMAGLSDKRVRERDTGCVPHLAKLDKYLAIYDYKYAEIEQVNRVATWERPDVLIYDFIKTPHTANQRTPEHRIIAGLGEGLANVANDARCTVFAFGQFSSSMSERFRRDHNLQEVTLFGSARLYHAADQVGIMKRHWTEPDTLFFKVKKDRLPNAYVNANLIDWEFTLHHSQYTQSFRQ